MIQKTSDFKTNLFIHGTYVEAPGGRLQSGRARGATLRGISSLIAGILVSGCAAAYSPAPLPANHPASPAAPEAPPPPPSQAFREESVPPAPAGEAPAQGPHSGHGAIPGGH
ncbi:MAG: hypothetical protein L0170_10680 [Acidobacteria bacterium]|nr:hypothetical protein [Acidobacteriota bacterium]